MKKLIFLLLFFVGFSSFSLAQIQDENPYNQSEKGAATNDKETIDPEPAAAGPGNPGDPISINNYSPILMISALGIITYFGLKKKALRG